jgi:hypothetical protein
MRDSEREGIFSVLLGNLQFGSFYASTCQLLMEEIYSPSILEARLLPYHFSRSIAVSHGRIS